MEIKQSHFLQSSLLILVLLSPTKLQHPSPSIASGYEHQSGCLYNFRNSEHFISGGMPAISSSVNSCQYLDIRPPSNKTLNRMAYPRQLLHNAAGVQCAFGFFTFTHPICLIHPFLDAESNTPPHALSDGGVGIMPFESILTISPENSR